MHEDLLGTKHFGELLPKPLARIDRIELDVTECIAGHVFACSRHFLDDGFNARAFGDEDVDAIVLVHDCLQSSGLGLDIQFHFGDEDRMNVLASGGEADGVGPLEVVEAPAVGIRCRRCEPTAVAAHHFVNDEHARVGVVLGDNVFEVLRAFFGGGPGAEALGDRKDIVVDGLRQADDGQGIVVLGEVGGEVGRGGVGVVTSDGVQHVNTVFGELLSSHLEWVFTFLDQAPLCAVCDIGQFDAAVADRTAAVFMQGGGVCADFFCNVDVVSQKEALVAAAVANDFNGGIELCIALNQSADCGRKAGGQTTGREDRHFLNGFCFGHDNSYGFRMQVEQSEFSDLLPPAGKPESIGSAICLAQIDRTRIVSAMVAVELEKIAMRNVRNFTLFRAFFSARFYYPVYALLFLDYGLTLGQFGILNSIWAATIVLLEVPSGALADTIGRKHLLIAAGTFMIIEMGVLLLAPIGGGGLLFTLFVVNRVLSGAAEAAASGADEALTYDSLKAAGMEDRWGKVLERVQRDTSLAFFFAMMTGAAVYDPQMVNAVLSFLGCGLHVEQADIVKLPVLLTLISGIVVFVMALRMREMPHAAEQTVGATLAKSWQQTMSAGRWIWATSLPFGIILAAMVLDSVVRQFLTLASEYWKVIDLPIASYGLIGSGMALMGIFVPRLARRMAEHNSVVKNFLLTSAAVFIGLLGLSFAMPYWGIVPAVFLYASIQMTGFFVSRYLNEAAPSELRATALSFRSLSTNLTYGAVALIYSGLIAGIKAGEDPAGYAGEAAFQKSVFVESLAYLPAYFLLTVAVVFVLHRLRFKPL